LTLGDIGATPDVLMFRALQYARVLVGAARELSWMKGELTLVQKFSSFRATVALKSIHYNAIIRFR